MVEMSAIVTARKGNERHNHDLEYRAKLDDVHMFHAKNKDVRYSKNSA